MKSKSRLQAARLSRGWMQGDLIEALVATAERLGVESPSPASWKTLVSMYENGRRPVSADHQPLFREAYQATNEELGFPESGILLENRSPHPPAGLLRTKNPVPISPELLRYLTSLLDQHAQAEPLVGPQFLLAPVQSQMPLIEQMCQDAYGPLREDVLRISARYIEFLGWLHQDTGHADKAMRWTSLAMEYAQELGDPMLIAYLFQRRSNIATEAGHAGHGAGLASAALRYAAQLSPRVHAVVLRQLANSKAGLGEAAETARAIDQALAAASRGDDADPMAGYCSVAYIEMEAANCNVRLERPGQAAEIYQESLSHWPAVQERDRGLCLARLATANALLEDVEGAHQAAEQALGIAQRTGSARILNELYRLQPHLAPWRKLVEVSELNRELDTMKRAAP
ncbi:helix-turn-helix transcriptional regulator [Streptomyces goshikiensis]|uniref:helix-turn-helix domain-containing protein n=1 Tax=Streptomyces goshikiensis TaxID=1942 RepID=UPI0022F3EE9C|nr:helix-turn-helix transcriptional regulator [Streptomyces goshikiensis]WBY21330.1 helix-turn-helix transcriptional regulator [Streptomyces goshikiensis]WSX98833.1 helix-turn-helix transcriptional regulator [Streptomyces goshikiensis]